MDEKQKIGEIYGETGTGNDSVKVLIQADGSKIGTKLLVLSAAEMPLIWIGQPSTTQSILKKVTNQLNENPTPAKFGKWDH